MNASFWAWPDRSHAQEFARLAAGITVLFSVVYVGCDLVTAHRALRVPLALPFEQRIPLLPALAWVYMSTYLPLWGAPLVLRTRGELRALAAALAAAIVVAGIAFLLLPARLAYPPAPDLGTSATANVFRLADRLNLDYNLAPSLHVALSATTLAALATRARRAGQALLLGWGLAIGASTLLTHQHHVVDVLGGYALAGAVFRSVYAPRTRGASSA